ncbi:MAG: hypothetical protein BWZ07_03125 [Alphaproteobacteria bacterium ADurb.BinA280]|nr:MAG: hypothetical protein BWZ07_03125 [Alphaproteobacteria bacterium ADurb.BinA280]
MAPDFSNSRRAAFATAASALPAAARSAASFSAPATAPIAPRATSPPAIVAGRDSATTCAATLGFCATAPSVGKKPLACSTFCCACCISGEYSAPAASAHLPNWSPVCSPSQSAARDTGRLTPVAIDTGAAAMSARPVAMPGICSTPRLRAVPMSPTMPEFCFGACGIRSSNAPEVLDCEFGIRSSNAPM